MKKILAILLSAAMLTSLIGGCSSNGSQTSSASSEAGQTASQGAQQSDAQGAGKKIAFCFQDLETEFWVAAHKSIVETLKGQGFEVVEYNGNQDANKQLEQVNDAIAQNVDGIILIPQDGESALTMIKTANKADVPIAIFNRPPTTEDGNAIVVVADNQNIAYKAGQHMVAQAKARYEKTKKKIVIGHMIGDLGDTNAIARKKGFEAAVAEAPDIFEKTVEIPTKWDANTALANLRNAMQANPDISMIFCGSDFLYPQIQSVLEPLGKWKKIGDDNHVILGAVDGDSGAGKLMDDGYVDATGVQDVYSEANACMTELLKAIQSCVKSPDKTIQDAGFALTQANMKEMHDKMWGNILRKASSSSSQS